MSTPSFFHDLSDNDTVIRGSLEKSGDPFDTAAPFEALPPGEFELVFDLLPLISFRHFVTISPARFFTVGSEF
jgi:hypothetical protein